MGVVTYFSHDYWPKVNYTLNGTRHHLGGIIVDSSAWVDIWRYLLMAAVMVIGKVGYHLHQCILDYLSNKPPGQQSLMDIFHRFHFRINQIIVSILAVVGTFIKHFFVSPGETFTISTMWFLYDVQFTSALCIGLNPVVQIILVFNPGLELPIPDNQAFYVLIAMVYGPLIILNVILHLNDIYPPLYYEFMAKDVKYPQFNYVQNALTLSTMMLFFIIRSILRRKRTASRDQPSKQLVKTKAMACSFLSILTLTFFFRLTHVPMEFLTPFGLTALFVVFPAIIIQSNEKTREMLSTKHHFLSKILDSVSSLSNYLHARICQRNRVSHEHQ